MRAKTKKEYEQLLNDINPPQGDKRWIINGKIAMTYMYQQKWGTAVRKLNPDAFEGSFKRWKEKDNIIK